MGRKLAMNERKLLQITVKEGKDEEDDPGDIAETFEAGMGHNA